MSASVTRPGKPLADDVDWWGLFCDPNFLADPYATLHALRARGPIQVDPVSGIYFVLGHDAFRRIATAPALGRDVRLWSGGWHRPEVERDDPLTFGLFSAFQPQMTNTNPPDHRRMRDVYEKTFRRDRIADFRPATEAACAALLDALPAEGGPVEFMEAVAHPLARSFARIGFGVAPADEERVAGWIADLAPIANVIMTTEQKRTARAALEAFKEYLRDRLADAASEPQDGFIALTATAVADGRLSEDEGLTNLVTLIAGGTATATLLGNGMLCLLRHPDQLDRLRADRGLMTSAIEEMLRFEPGGSFILRVAIRDVALDDIVIPAGAMVIALIGATNRDPARFDHPDHFRIDRRPNPQSVFGAGPHVCLGKTVVRMTAEVCFDAMLDRFEPIELAGEPVWWTHRSDQHGLHRLPLRLGPKS